MDLNRISHRSPASLWTYPGALETPSPSRRRENCPLSNDSGHLASLMAATMLPTLVSGIIEPLHAASTILSGSESG